MAEQTTQPAGGLDRAAEEAGFYHEAALNAAWTGSRFAARALSLPVRRVRVRVLLPALGQLAAAGGRAPAITPPQTAMGAIIMAIVRGQRHRPVRGAAADQGGREERLAGRRHWWRCCSAWPPWSLQIIQLLNLPFAAGRLRVLQRVHRFYPVMLVSWLAAMIWLEILIMRARPLPAISFVEQPPTYAEAFAVQRFQSSLSAFTLIWNFSPSSRSSSSSCSTCSERKERPSGRLTSTSAAGGHDRHEHGCLALVGQRGGARRVPAGHGRAPGRAARPAGRRAARRPRRCRAGWAGRRSPVTPACWPCCWPWCPRSATGRGTVHLGPLPAGPAARRGGAAADRAGRPLAGAVARASAAGPRRRAAEAEPGHRGARRAPPGWLAGRWR